MAKIKLNGDTSGYIEISAPAVSGNNTLELGPGTKILTNLDNTFTGVSTFSSDVYLGNDIYLTDGSSGHEQVEVDSNDIRVTGKHIHSQFGVWTRSASVNNRRNGIDGDNNDLLLYANSAERLRITSDGKLLIGSDTGSIHGNRLLQIGKTNRAETYVSIVSSTSSESGLLFADTTTNDTGGYRGQIRYHHSDDSMNFRTAATQQLRITSGGNVLLGNTTSTSTASPVNLSLGGTYSNSYGQNPKLNLWEDSVGDYMSLGVSSSQMDFMMSRDDYDFVWYGQNDSDNGPEERMRLDNGNKLLDFASTCKIRLRGAAYTGQTHAHLNIGSQGATNTDTRAIDIWGSWQDQESKSITWNHGTGTSNIVCQQRVRYNTTPSHSIYEIGRLYHNQDTTAFPFQLESTGTTTANLTIDGQIYNRNQSFVAYSTQSDNIQSSTKIDYTVSQSYGNVFSNSNSRFTAQRAGLYLFYARHWFIAGSSGTVYLDMMKNGTSVKEFRVTHPSSSTEYETIQGTALVYMAVNDYMEVNGSAAGGASLHESTGTRHSEFSGFYVSG